MVYRSLPSFASGRNRPVRSKQWVLVVLSAAVTLSASIATIRLPAPVPASAMAARQLTIGPWSDVDQTFSPDGQTIVFASNRSGDFDIWVMNANGRHQTRLTSMLGDERCPKFSPDGKKIAFLARDSRTTDIWVISAHGEGLSSLTDDDAIEESFEWSPLGDLLAYDSNKGGRWNIWLTDVHDKSRVQLTRGEGDNQYPTWSRDGRLIAFVRQSGIESQIWTASISEGRARQITSTNGNLRFPTFSPTLNQVAYLSDSGGRWSIWITDLDDGTEYDAFIPVAPDIIIIPFAPQVQVKVNASNVNPNMRIKWDVRGVTILFAAKSATGSDEAHVVMPNVELGIDLIHSWSRGPVFTKLALDSGSRILSIEWGRDWRQVLVSTFDGDSCKVLLLQYESGGSPPLGYGS